MGERAILVEELRKIMDRARMRDPGWKEEVPFGEKRVGKGAFFKFLRERAKVTRRAINTRRQGPGRVARGKRAGGYIYDDLMVDDEEVSDGMRRRDDREGKGKGSPSKDDDDDQEDNKFVQPDENLDDDDRLHPLYSERGGAGFRDEGSDSFEDVIHANVPARPRVPKTAGPGWRRERLGIPEEEFFPGFESKLMTWRTVEVEFIVAAHQVIGPRWREMAKFLPGRGRGTVKSLWRDKIAPLVAEGYFDLSLEHSEAIIAAREATMRRKLNRKVCTFKPRPWTVEEDELFIAALAVLGRSWVIMAELFPGRTYVSLLKHWTQSVRAKVEAGLVTIPAMDDPVAIQTIKVPELLPLLPTHLLHPLFSPPSYPFPANLSQHRLPR